MSHAITAAERYIKENPPQSRFKVARDVFARDLEQHLNNAPKGYTLYSVFPSLENYFTVIWQLKVL